MTTTNTKAELTAKQIKAGWEHTFSTNNPFCPCDLKSFTKAVNWAERALDATAPERQVGAPPPLAPGVPTKALHLVEDAAQAHAQRRAVVHMALSLAEVYVARAAILAADPKAPVEIIGESSAATMEWLGDLLSNMDAVEDEDEWLDPIFDAAQARWPVAVQQQATRLDTEPAARFCPGCGSVGEVPDKFRDCCPDGGRARVIPAALAGQCHDLFKLALLAARAQPQADAAEPVATEDARDVIGKALSDYMTENSEAGVFSTDPFDSREIDALADAVLAAQAPGARGGA